LYDGLEASSQNRWPSLGFDLMAVNSLFAPMPHSTVFGVYDGGVHAVVERVADHLPVPSPHQPRQRFWRVVAKRAVLAAGARTVVAREHDRPLGGDNS
jgi:hypothetical protein